MHRETFDQTMQITMEYNERDVTDNKQSKHCMITIILQTPEYLSRATMRLPMNLRVRWYEHIDGRRDRSTPVEFDKWLRK